MTVREPTQDYRLREPTLVDVALRVSSTSFEGNKFIALVCYNAVKKQWSFTVHEKNVFGAILNLIFEVNKNEI